MRTKEKIDTYTNVRSDVIEETVSAVSCIEIYAWISVVCMRIYRSSGGKCRIDDGQRFVCGVYLHTLKYTHIHSWVHKYAY